MAIHYDRKLKRFRDDSGHFVSRERAMHSSVARRELAAAQRKPRKKPTPKPPPPPAKARKRPTPKPPPPPAKARKKARKAAPSPPAAPDLPEAPMRPWDVQGAYDAPSLSYWFDEAYEWDDFYDDWGDFDDWDTES